MNVRVVPLVAAIIVLVGCTTGGGASPSAPAVATPSGPPSSAVAPTTPPEVSFAGKEITLYIPFPPGGGYDAVGRLVAKNLGNHLSGNPPVIPNNRTGAYLSENLLASEDPKDGTAVAITFRSVAVSQLLQQQGVEYDVREFEWLGSFASSTYAIVVQKSSGITDLEGIKNQPTPLRAEAASRDQIDLAQTAMPMLRILGYEVNQPLGGAQAGLSTAESILAFERGELQILALDYATLVSRQADWLKNDFVTIVASVGACKVPANELLAGRPEVPCLTDPEFVKTVSTDPAALGMAQIVQNFTVAGRPFLLPAGTQPEVVAAMRTAFEETMADPVFVSEANELGFQVDPVGAEEVAELQEQILASSAETVALLKEWFSEAN